MREESSKENIILESNFILSSPRGMYKLHFKYNMETSTH